MTAGHLARGLSGSPVNVPKRFLVPKFALARRKMRGKAEGLGQYRERSASRRLAVSTAASARGDRETARRDAMERHGSGHPDTAALASA
jgi:hypothetical protein